MNEAFSAKLKGRFSVSTTTLTSQAQICRFAQLGDAFCQCLQTKAAGFRAGGTGFSDTDFASTLQANRYRRSTGIQEQTQASSDGLSCRLNRCARWA